MASHPIKIPTFPNPKAEEFESFSPKRGRPFLFQIADPVFQRPLYPVLLALHVNPQSVSEKMQKTKSVVSTYGGFVEFIWPEELDTLSADQTTGAFISPVTGLTSGPPSSTAENQGRHGTIAWERMEDLLELFRSNGAIFNAVGQPILRGRVLCIYDRGIFAGHFTTFNVSESDDKAFTLQLSWEFRVEQTVYRFPSVSGREDLGLTTGDINKGNSRYVVPPSFTLDDKGKQVFGESISEHFAEGVNNGQFDLSGEKK